MGHLQAMRLIRYVSGSFENDSFFGLGLYFRWGVRLSGSRRVESLVFVLPRLEVLFVLHLRLFGVGWWFFCLLLLSFHLLLQDYIADEPYPPTALGNLAQRWSRTFPPSLLPSHLINQLPLSPRKYITLILTKLTILTSFFFNNHRDRPVFLDYFSR